MFPLLLLISCVTVILAQYGNYPVSPYYSSRYSSDPRMYYQQQYARQQNYGNYGDYYRQYYSNPGYYNGYSNNYYNYNYQMNPPLPGFRQDENGNWMTGTKRAGFYLSCQGRACQGNKNINNAILRLLG